MCGGAPTSRVPGRVRGVPGRVGQSRGRSGAVPTAGTAGWPGRRARVVVNGRAGGLARWAGMSPCSSGCAGSGLTGCKEGCAEGECGACAVLVARDDSQGRTSWVAINACLVPAAAFDQQEVVTAEGLGQPGRLHPVQREMAERGGSQCGYCTPGFICSMAAEYYRPGRGELNGHHDAEHGPNGFDLHALSGNLCRCTGYRPIKDAAYALGQPEAADPFLARLAEPAPAPAATATSSAQGRYVRPANLAEALGLLAAEPDARLVAGSTDWGVELNIRHSRAALTVGIDRIPELREFSASRDRIDIGAALSLSEIEARLAGRVPLLGAAVPAVRVAPDPQRGHARRQPRHRLADRRHPARTARAGRVPGAGLQPGRAGGPAGRVLHRLPAERQAPRRADQDDPHPAARRPGHRVPQDRQAPVRRHLRRGGGVRAEVRRRYRWGRRWNRSGSAWAG